MCSCHLFLCCQGKELVKNLPNCLKKEFRSLTILKLGFTGFFELIPTLSQGRCYDKSLLLCERSLKEPAEMLGLCLGFIWFCLLWSFKLLNYNKFIFQLGFGKKKTQYLVF